MINLQATLLFFLLSVFFAECLAVTHPPLSKMAVQVIDEGGVPVGGVYVKAPSYWTEGWNAGQLCGLTETNGLFCYKDRVFREVSYYAMKKGYYDSHGEAWWPKNLFEIPETNLVVELKRIIDPVEMKQYEIRTFMPITEKPIGFDLAVGDWVVPHGKGVVSDIYFTGVIQFESRKNFEVRIHGVFTNGVDGVLDFIAPRPNDFRKMKSELMPPQLPPDSGYQHDFFLWHSNSREKRSQGHEKPDRNYLFRTRVETNDVGQIIKANYGWTVGEITVDAEGDVGKRIWLNFRYYYNPDPTSRSLEPKEIADQQAKDIPEPAK